MNDKMRINSLSVTQDSSKAMRTQSELQIRWCNEETSIIFAVIHRPLLHWRHACARTVCLYLSGRLAAHERILNVLCGAFVAKYLRASLTVRNTLSGGQSVVARAVGEAITHKAFCTLPVLSTFSSLLLWRNPGSQTFCVKYKRHW
jgi:hypothetical protein